MEASKMTKHPLIIEEWNGSSSTKLFKTATITFSPSLQIQSLIAGFPRQCDSRLCPFSSMGLFAGTFNIYKNNAFYTSKGQALLSAIGVGEKSATIIGATFQWFLRDLTGMLGGILFTLYQGSNLDSNAKMWRLVADLMNDLGMLMDLLSPLFPSAFIFIVCLGSLSRSFTSVASGATRAALTQHFALQNNAADIAAK
ncbi:hypothetical protein Gohar_005152, partial [Gossypium harknessii]|nr:hypothetical protein [Gossypium harknessii]